MPTAVVIGAGLAGLSTAAGLLGRGWDVRVIERRATQSVVGTVLILQPAALRALASLGLETQVHGAAVPIGFADIRSRSGMRISPRRRLDSVLAIGRPALTSLLTGLIPPERLHYGNTTSSRDRAALAEHADVLVAADGVNSATRTEIFGSRYVARHAGASIWRGTIDGPAEGLVEYWGSAQRFGLSARPDGRTNWYASARAEPGIASPDGELAALRRRFSGWNPRVDDALSRLTETEILHHASYAIASPLPSFVSRTTALVGDAAHAMTPDLGRGANEAILDAAFLARQLADAPDVPEALRRYDAARRRPAQRVAAASAAVNRVVHARWGRRG